MIQERPGKVIGGWTAVFGIILLALVALGSLGLSLITNLPWLAVAAVIIGAFDFFCLGGFYMLNPNQGAVLQLFGSYIGSTKQPGFWWVFPLITRKRISLRVRNFESGKLKVNDRDGNPIEIAAIVVWNVSDMAEALFNVESYDNFVQIQSEAAVRNLAVSYPYDEHLGEGMSLRGNTKEIADELKREVQERLAKAGVVVIEARISHLAYAPEIASAMLRRQQANAIIAARQRIVEGAVGMVEMALDKLEMGGKVKLDEERKAAMVSNLLVVLTSDRDAQPVVNTGTLYQ